MGDVVQISTGLPHVRALVQFMNHDQACLVIRQDKAKSDAKVFREAASMLGGSDRGKVIAEWLNDLAGKYEQMENPQAQVPEGTESS
jgi:hypothetical protein